MLPEWYKNTESYIGGEKKPSGKGISPATIKRCMPVFDSLNAGYMLITHADIFVTQKEEIDPITNKLTGKKNSWFEWPAFDSIEFHDNDQAPFHPKTNGSAIPKWINPWSIKTPKGYSTLFVPPFHHNNIFTALVGVVDTDSYTSPVNIVFTLSDPNFEGLVPAGTPIAQVIPFKRENWKMSIGDEENKKEQHNVYLQIRSKFFDSYKDKFRKLKEYK